MDKDNDKNKKKKEDEKKAGKSRYDYESPEKKSAGIPVASVAPIVRNFAFRDEFEDKLFRFERPEHELAQERDMYKGELSEKPEKHDDESMYKDELSEKPEKDDKEKLSEESVGCEDEDDDVDYEEEESKEKEDIEYNSPQPRPLYDQTFETELGSALVADEYEVDYEQGSELKIPRKFYEESVRELRKTKTKDELRMAQEDAKRLDDYKESKAKIKKPVPNMFNKMEEDFSKFLALKKIKPEENVVYPVVEKQPPNSKNRILTNVYPARYQGKKGIHLYKLTILAMYDVSTSVGWRRIYHDLSQGGKYDPLVIQGQSQARLAFIYLVRSNKNIFPKLTEVAYDNRMFVYSPVFFKFPENKLTADFTLKKEDHPELWAQGWEHSDVDKISYSFEYVHELDTSVINVEKEMDHNLLDRTLMTLANQVTSQNVMNLMGSYINFHAGLHFPLNPSEFNYQFDESKSKLGNDVYASPGSTKICRLTEGSGKNPQEFGIVVGYKVGAFHNCELLSDKILHMYPTYSERRNGESVEVEKAIHQLVCMTIHLHRPRIYVIRGLTSLGANELKFRIRDSINHSDSEITVKDYFETKHKLKLKYPNMPCAIARAANKRDNIFLPTECLEIMDMQRLTAHQTFPVQIAALIKLCALPPRYVHHQILTNVKTYQFRKNDLITNFGIEVSETPYEPYATNIAHPTIMYRKEQSSEVQRDKFSWRAGHQFVVPATIKSWSICVVDSGGNCFSARDASIFCDAFVQSCKAKGMNINHTKDIIILKLNSDIEMTNAFGSDRGRYDYCIFLTDKRCTTVHHEMKFSEQQSGLRTGMGVTKGTITQNITMDVAAAACGLRGNPKRLTMDNIVAKANLKNGGLNYIVGDNNTNLLVGKQDLFISYGISAAPGQRPRVGDESFFPTVVGYSANDGYSIGSFTGDYIYQTEPRFIPLETVEEIIITVLERYQKNRKDFTPRAIFIYRNNCPEHLFENIMKYEIPLIKHCVKKYFGDAKIVYIVPNKAHNVRLFPESAKSLSVNEQNPPSVIEQNVKPGVVIDSEITHRTIPEFYCLGHVARQGTVAVPRYSILDNSAKLTMKDIQSLTYSLCYYYQIITSAVSLPTPSYIAEQFAKRGLYLLQVHRLMGNEYTENDVYKLNEVLSYRFTDLRNQRYNA